VPRRRSHGGRSSRRMTPSARAVILRSSGIPPGRLVLEGRARQLPHGADELQGEEQQKAQPLDRAPVPGPAAATLVDVSWAMPTRRPQRVPDGRP
jgi:hypothetical protein